MLGDDTNRVSGAGMEGTMITRPRIVEPDAEPVDVGTKERLGRMLIWFAVAVIALAVVLCVGTAIFAGG